MRESAMEGARRSEGAEQINGEKKNEGTEGNWNK